MRGDTAEVDGEALKRLRKAKGWTQQELAAKAGYETRVLQKMESGKSVKLETIRDFAQVLKINVNDILLNQQFKQDENIDLSYFKVRFEIIKGSEISALEMTMPADGFPDSTYGKAFAAFISAIIPAQDQVSFDSAHEGSVIAILIMTERDIVDFIERYQDRSDLRAYLIDSLSHDRYETIFAANLIGGHYYRLYRKMLHMALRIDAVTLPSSERFFNKELRGKVIRFNIGQPPSGGGKKSSSG